jgi:hypothetical protein
MENWKHDIQAESIHIALRFPSITLRFPSSQVRFMIFQLIFINNHYGSLLGLHWSALNGIKASRSTLIQYADIVNGLQRDDPRLLEPGEECMRDGVSIRWERCLCSVAIFNIGQR